MKRSNKKRIAGLLMAVIFTLSCLCVSTSSAPSAYQSNFSNFITLKDGKLMDGDKVFRFWGWNIPNLDFIEDTIEGYVVPNDYEIEDALKTASQMGATAIRILNISIRGPVGGVGITHPRPAHMEGPQMYNEITFRALDKALELADKYKIRVVMPGFDSTTYWGGIKAISAFRGKEPEEFWEDPELIEDAKAFFNYLINRTNYYTGVKYKDDKSVLAWSLGNEIQNYWVPDISLVDNWSKKMSKYIKSIDSKHLVQDGRSLKWAGILDDPNMDIIDSHYYPHNAPDPIARLQTEMDLINGTGKVLVLGEFGFFPTETIKTFMDEAMNSPLAGGLLWSLRFHSRNGGFYFHGEGEHGGQKWEAYHWPGFPSGDHQDETNFLKIYREYAYKINGAVPPPLPAPDAPVMLAVTNLNDIRWRGAAGASSYDIERATLPTGPWDVIGKNITDDKDLERVAKGHKLFADTSAVAGTEYYYRAKAINQSGESPYSNVVKLGEPQKTIDSDSALIGYGLENTLSPAVTLYIGSSKSYTKSGVVDIDSSDPSVVPIVDNGRTLVPVRFISENMGAKVAWDNDTKTVTITSDKGKTAKLTIGSNSMTVNGSNIPLDVPAKIIGGRTLIPLRALAENVLDKKVFYDRSLIVISDEVLLDAGKDQMYIDTIIGKLFDVKAIKPQVFPVPTPIPTPTPISKATEIFVDKFDSKASLDQFIDKRYVAIDGTNAYGYFAKDKGRLRKTDQAYPLEVGAPYAFATYKTEKDITGFKVNTFYTAPGYNPEYDLIFSVSSDNVNFTKVQVKKTQTVDTLSVNPNAYLKFLTENEAPLPAGIRYLKIEWYNSFGEAVREPSWSPQLADIEITLNKDSK